MSRNLVAEWGKNHIRTLKDICALSNEKLYQLCTKIVSNNKEVLMQYVGDLPRLKLDFNVVNSMGEVQIPLPSNSIYQLSPNTEYDINITTEVLRGKSNFKLYAPKYHKQKSTSWWVVLGSSADELVAMKKITSIGSSGSGNGSSYGNGITLKFVTDSAIDREFELIVHVIPDSIHGLEITSKFRYVCS
jgi:hypothetical protein